MRRDGQAPLTRSQIMGRVKGRDTKPELIVRRMLHSLGYRYRLQFRSLPGSPDIAFTARRAAVFVHGCFWHGHDCARAQRMPKTNAAYWTAKIARNRARDREVASALEALGWRQLTIWECELRDPDALAERLRAFLGPPRAPTGSACRCS